MQNLIAPEIRPVIKNAAHFSRRGCSDASEAFANFSYNELTSASVLPNELAFEDFSPCDYLPHLQQVLFSTDMMDANVTYETFVVVPVSLNNSLSELLGDKIEFNGPFVSFDHISPTSSQTLESSGCIHESQSNLLFSALS